MSDEFKLSLDTDLYKGTVSVNTGLFIDGKWSKPIEGGTIECVVLEQLAFAVHIDYLCLAS